MTVSQALSAVDMLKPNSYNKSVKIGWLNELDMTVQHEIRDTHESGGSFSGYTDTVDGDTALLVPEPYSMMYTYYLMAKIDFFNAETGKFNVTAEMFNNTYSQYLRHYNSTHKPLQQNSIHFSGVV